MTNIGIFAAEQERLHRYPWYEGWKNRRPHLLPFPEQDLCFVVAYQGQNIKKLFSNYQVTKVVATDQALNQLPPLPPPLTWIDGGELYQQLLPTAVKKVCKLAGFSPDNNHLCIFDESADQSLALIEQLSLSFRYITLITRQVQRARQLAEQAMEQFGLAVAVQSGRRIPPCNIAVLLSDGPVKLPIHTIVIDRHLAHNTMDQRAAINNFGVQIGPKLPFAISSLAVCQAMAPQVPLKINAFLLDGNQVKFH